MNQIKKISFFLFLAVFAFIISGCGSSENNTETTSENNSQEPTQSEETNNESNEESKKITIGYVKVIAQAGLPQMVENLKAEGIEAELVEFQRYADVRTALASNQIDYGAIGPQDISLALSSGSDNLNAIIGVGSGNETIVVNNNVEVESWEDLKDVKIGIGSASIAWIKFVASVLEHDIKYKDLETVNVAGSGQSYVDGLKNDSLDVAVVWEPFGAQAVLEEVAYYPSFDINSSKQVGGMTAVLAATNDSIQDKETTQAVVTSLTQVMDKFNEDSDFWHQEASEFTGLSTEIVELAIEGSNMIVDYNMPIEEMKNMSTFMAENGITEKDVSDELEKHIDYTFLEEATGKTAQDLGKTN